MNEYLVKTLKKGRIDKGLKQSDVAEMVGVKANTLSNYENGVSEPDIDTFANLCDIYGLDFAYVLGEAYGLSVQGGDFFIKPSEIEHIKKYRALDDHGKEMVDIVLGKEHSRCVDYIVNTEAGPVIIESQAHTTDMDKRIRHYNETLMAAHNDHADEPGELEKMQEDLANLSQR